GGAARFRIAPVEVQRVYRVIGDELLAVRERHALAQVEGPGLGAVGRLPALRQLGMRLPVLRPFRQAVPDAMAGVDEHGIGGGAEIEAVGGAAAREAKLE